MLLKCAACFSVCKTHTESYTEFPLVFKAHHDAIYNVHKHGDYSAAKAPKMHCR